MKYIDNRLNANIVKLEDANNNYISENVEGALEEIDSKIKIIEANGYDDTQIRQNINDIKTELGSAALNTDAINIKDAINEVNTRIKTIETNSYDDTQIKQDINNIKTKIGTKELTTTDQTIKGAVNEIDSQIKDLGKLGYNTSISTLKQRFEMYYVNVMDFGAVGDGVNDDTIPFQNALNQTINNKCCIYVPPGKYRITQTLTLENVNSTIFGSGEYSILLKDFNGNLIEGNSQKKVSKHVFKDFCIDGNKKDGHGFFTTRVEGIRGCGSLIFDNVCIKNNNGNGLHLESSYVTRIVDGDYLDNGGYGIYITEGNNITIDHVNIYGNNKGLHIGGGSFATTIISPCIQENKCEAIELASCYAVTILNPYIEKNGLNGTPSISLIKSDDRPQKVSIFNPYITGKAGASTHGIHIQSGRNVSIFYPFINTCNGDAIKLDTDAWDTAIFGVHISPSVQKFVNDGGYSTSINGTSQAESTNNRPENGCIVKGYNIFDKTLNKPIWWNGSNWVDATGEIV